MKTSVDIKKFYLLIVLGLFPIYLFGQLDHVFALQNKAGIGIDLDMTITDNTHLEPFKSQMIISGLVFSGEITLHSDSSLVRIVLMDNNDSEYLIYEAYPILSGLRQFSVEEAGEETSLLKNITPSKVTVELVDASIYLKEIIISGEETYQPKTKGAILVQQTMNKIDRINLNIQKTGQTWVAGETSISILSYQEKKSMFGGSVPNFQGCEYYLGGVFVLPGAKDELGSRDIKVEKLSLSESQFASEFSWKNRHGKDWVTSVKKQMGCGACWAFGQTAATELLVNLYFNRHIDYDLSEQNIISCTQGTCSEGGSPSVALSFIMNTGIVLEDCFPYYASDLDCSDVCSNPTERIKIDNWKIFYDEEEKKREIIHGATVAAIYSWSHSVQIIGYKIIEAGDHLFVGGYDTTNYISIEQDNPLIGETAWLCKNSWGESWGNNGYGYFIGDRKDIKLNSLSGPVSSLLFNEDYVLCTDNDGDGYYCWGIGPKPSHCPECPDEPDGDDSDPCIGPMDEYGNLKSITPTPEAKDTLILYDQMVPDLIATGSNIQWYSDIKLLNLVHTGNVFPTGQTEIGDYTYYISQTLSGCESEANEVSLSIWLEIPRPIGHDTVININEAAVLKVEGEPKAEFKWYEDPLLTKLLDTGESYETEKSDTGTYTYYVTQTLYLLESAPDTVILKIKTPITIPDIAFLHVLIDEGVDTNGDSLISYTEAEAVTFLNVSREIRITGKISNMTGIEAFINLDTLVCDNNQLTSLEVSNNSALWYLQCSGNLLNSLDLSNNISIGVIDIGNMPFLNKVCVWTIPFPSEIVEVDITGSPNVEFKYCSAGIEDYTSSGLTIYPNPTNSILTIDSEFPDHYSIRITSLNGQLIYSTVMEGNSFQIDLSSFQKGVYLITIRSKDFVTTRKIIKL